jgi:HemY protein
MLWSLTKILVFMAALTATTFGASFLMEAQGGMTIEYGGIELNLKPLQATLLMFFLLICVWFLLKLMGLLIAVAHFINGDETALSRYFDRNRERRGFEALSSGLMALASSDGREAMVAARKAGKLLNRPDLTNLVLAQAAGASGDKKTATEACAITRFVRLGRFNNRPAFLAPTIASRPSPLANAMRPADKASKPRR